MIFRRFGPPMPLPWRHLPVQLTRFVGREDQIAQVREILDQ